MKRERKEISGKGQCFSEAIPFLWQAAAHSLGLSLRRIQSLRKNTFPRKLDSRALPSVPGGNVGR